MNTMNDQPAQDSYVHSYQPPVVDSLAAPAAASAPTSTSDPMSSSSAPMVQDPAPLMAAPEPSFPAMPSSPQPMSTPAAPTATPATDQPRSVSQTLEDQNIFFLLGVNDGTDEEREAFLDELQQVIWEDFVENDVELLITSDEMVEFKKIMDKGDSPEVQEEMIVYLEKLIPDLEEIMLEKALELKEDMVRERIAGMKSYYASNADSLQKVTEAEQLINQDQWRAAAELLNGLE